jgi:Phospholipase_D-nuclease N-terminal
MEGLSASVVLIAILLGVLLVVVFDVFCLLHLGTADSAPFVPRFAWAVLIVVASPIGGLAYLLAQRLRTRWPEPVAMRPRSLLRNEPWQSPTLAEYRHAPSTPLGHGVAVMAITVAAIWLRRARSWRPRRLGSRPGDHCVAQEHGQHLPGLVHHLHVVVVLSPVITHEQPHQHSPITTPNPDGGQRENIGDPAAKSDVPLPRRKYGTGRIGARPGGVTFAIWKVSRHPSC